jgi:glycosyltransferase 2 family protein
MNEVPVTAARRPNYLRAAGTIIALALLVYLLSQQGWAEIWNALSQISVWRLLLTFGLMMVSRLAVSARWYVLLRAADVKIRIDESTRITFAGLFASNFLPTTIGGDVIRLAGAIHFKFDTAICAASLVADRLVGMAGMAMFLPLGLPAFLQAGGFKDFERSWLHIPEAGLVAALENSRFNKIWARGKRLTVRLLKSLTIWVKKPYALLLSLLFSWVHMLCLFGILALLLNAMGDSASLWLVGGLYSLVYFISLLPISINGYGLQEISMTFIFTSVIGVSMSNALATALIFRTLMMIASLPGALFVPDMMASHQPPPSIPAE